MSTFTQIYYHIIFSTKYRKPTLDKEYREELFKYIWGIIKNKKCHLYRINGIEDHVHIFSSLHPSLSLSDFIRDIKVASNGWMKRSGHFPAFTEWQDGYAAFTHSSIEKDRLVKYVINQEEHHKTVSFLDELKALLEEAGIPFEEKYLE